MRPRSEDAKQQARERLAQEIKDSSGGRISSEQADRKAVEIAQRVERKRSEKGER